MARPRINPQWRTAIFFLMAGDESRSAAAISRLLSQVAPYIKERVPSARTIARVQDEWRQMSSADKQQVRNSTAFFRWPESMEAGLLPWEASAALLELLRYQRE